MKMNYDEPVPQFRDTPSEPPGKHYDDAPVPNSSRAQLATTAEPAGHKKDMSEAFGFDVQQWATSGRSYWATTTTAKALAAGIYRADLHPAKGIVFSRQDVKTDSLMELPDDAGKMLLNEFDQFWQRRDRYNTRGMLHKRGFMLWGPPGSGKTSTLSMMSNKLVREHGGIVLYIDHPGCGANALSLLRAIEPDRPVVCIIEDIDALTQNYGEQQFLALLDGEAQIDRVVFIATTNYPERLDLRFVNRPSRFDTIKFVGMPSAAARNAYLAARAPELSEVARAEWVKLTEGFSVAHLRELVIAHYVLDQPVADAINRLERMRFKPKSDRDPDAEPMGFFGKR